MLYVLCVWWWWSQLCDNVNSFSVWLHDSATKEATLWSHQTPTHSPLNNTTGFVTEGNYLDDTTVVVTTSNGFIELYTQKKP
jgi:hypothetical protein